MEVLLSPEELINSLKLPFVEPKQNPYGDGGAMIDHAWDLPHRVSNRKEPVLVLDAGHTAEGC